jgi:hypothetical protein
MAALLPNPDILSNGGPYSLEIRCLFQLCYWRTLMTDDIDGELFAIAIIRTHPGRVCPLSFCGCFFVGVL